MKHMDDLDINSLSLWSETALKSFLQAKQKLTSGSHNDIKN